MKGLRTPAQATALRQDVARRAEQLNVEVHFFSWSERVHASVQLCGDLEVTQGRILSKSILFLSHFGFLGRAKSDMGRNPAEFAVGSGFSAPQYLVSATSALRKLVTPSTSARSRAVAAETAVSVTCLSAETS